MATKLYFHNAAQDTSSGTWPSSTAQLGDCNSVGWNSDIGGFSLKTMNTNIGTGQTSVTGASSANTSAIRNHMATFVSPPLSGSQTVGGGSIILNAAEAESNTNANFWINLIMIKVYRPSTGATVGCCVNFSGSSLGGLEPTSASAEQVTHITGIASSAISASDGDVVIISVGSLTSQAMATSYNYTMYYDGTTENTTENAAVSNHASYVQFTENLVFQGAPAFTPVNPLGTTGFFGI